MITGWFFKAKLEDIYMGNIVEYISALFYYTMPT